MIDIDLLVIKKIIKRAKFFDCFKLRLVCHDWNQLIVQRMQKLENWVALIFVFWKMGYQNPWNFHISFKTCRNIENCDTLWVNDIPIDFEKKCERDQDHVAFNYCDSQLINQTLFIIGRGVNKIYKFNGQNFAKERNFDFWFTDYQKSVFISKDQVWHMDMNYDGSILIPKPKTGQKMLLKNVLNGSDPSDPARNQLYSDNSLVFEGYDNDCDSIIVRYLLLDDKIIHCFDFGETHCNIVGWTNQFMLMETEKHLMKFESKYKSWVVKHKPCLGFLFQFHFIDINDHDTLHTTEPIPKRYSFSELDDDYEMQREMSFSNYHSEVVQMEFLSPQ